MTEAATAAPAPVFDWTDLGRFKRDGIPEGYPPNLRTFWAGVDDVHGLLVALLNSARQSIVLNMFGYDDLALDQIIRTKMLNERIYVQMSLDSTQAAGVHEHELLAAWPHDAIGTSVAIGQSAHHAISHLKVCIVDGLHVVTGSTNWSLAGEQRQDNEVRLIRDPVVAHETRTVLDVNHSVMLQQMARRAAASR